MNRPRVVVQSSASVDGRVTIAPDTLLLFGEERWNAVAGASDLFEWLKFIHKPEATLEGSGSFIPDHAEPEPLPPFDGNPRPLYEDFLPDEIVHRPGHQGWFTAVDGRGRIRWLYKDGAAWPGGAWEGWYALVLVAHHTPPAYLAYLRRENIPYLVAGEARVDLCAALEKMHSRLGVTCLLSTAGGKLNGALLRAGLVDEINVEFFPAIIGGPDTPSLFDAPALKADEWPSRLKLVSAQVRPEGRVWLRYQVVRGGG
jgi:riboflavin biosynthesis pyrimidine reductase